METGQENISFEINGEVAYCQATTEKNGVRVIVPMKKHHFTEFDEAVKRQLMYFENVVYKIRDEYGNDHGIPVRPNILYQDDSIVISDNQFFSKPHILINNVNYGFINFDELEIENVSGNIGLKVSPEEVEVSPSRENLIWEEKTREAVVQRLRDAQKSASALISESMDKETDFIAWLNKVKSIVSSWSAEHTGSTVLATLAKIVSADRLDFVFKSLIGSPILFKKDFFEDLDFKALNVCYTTKQVKGQVTRTIDRSKSIPMYHKVALVSTRLSNRKDKFLLSTEDYFTVIHLPDRYKTEEYRPGFKQLDDAEVNTTFHKLQMQVIRLLLASPSVVPYEEIQVPDTWHETEEEEDVISAEEQTEEEVKASYLSKKDRRLLNKEILVHTLTRNTLYYSQESARTILDFPFRKTECKTTEIDAWNNEEIYWGNEADSKVLIFVSCLLSQNGPTTGVRDFDNSPVRLFKVAKDNIKYVKDFQHIQKFFAQKRGSTITMSSYLIRWNTARLLLPKMPLLNFMQGLSQIPQYTEQYDKYAKVVQYVSGFENLERWPTLKSTFSTAMDDMVRHLDKVYQFQKLVADGATAEQIATVATEMWGSPTITDGCAVNIEIVTIFEELLDWSTSIRTLLNTSKVLNSRDEEGYTPNGHFDFEEASEHEMESIADYIKLKTT